MQLTCVLPYELLQIISSNLLPRYQCRLALTSTWCYKYLYTPLLKWHARKFLIPVPEHNIYCEKHEMMTVIMVPRDKPHILLLEVVCGNLYIKNITRMYISTIRPFNVNTCDRWPRGYMYSSQVRWQFKIYRNFDILRGYYQYVNKDVLLIYINTRRPIFSLNRELTEYLCGKLSYDDINNLYNTCII